MSELALFGGQAVRRRPFPANRLFGADEKAAAQRVLDSGILSGFIGAWHPAFLGGPEVRAFEAKWAEQYAAKFAVAVNSCTSGLYACIGAAGVGPGDEVIVSPYTMSASVTAPIVFNAVPVFADIDPVTYNLDPRSIEERITPRTRAILVVHIFGQSADMDPIMAFAAKHDLIVIEDCAQSPLATYKGRPVGTLGHMGVFSLNYHKHIHTGEGGMVTTNDPAFAEKVQLIRNHAEAVMAGKPSGELVNMIGFNFRLGEIEAAIGACQLEKAPGLIAARQANVRKLESMLAGIPGLSMPAIGPAGDHVYYQHALDFDREAMGLDRDVFVKALKAELADTELREQEGPIVSAGYVKPLYLLPMFQQQIGYGKLQCPFKCPHYIGKANYDAGLCPSAERAHFERVIIHEYMRPAMSEDDMRDFADAVHKVIDHVDELRASESVQA
jgi:dTDP-4-amino-4,6-dideoxygalactose transaminase